MSELQGHYPASLEIETVDIVEAASVACLARTPQGRAASTVLFVNAGICKAHEETPSTVDERDFVDMMLTNALGPMRAVELFENLVPTSGAIAVMTSELGSIAENRGFWELYSSSKAALNMLMKCFSALACWRSTRALAARARLGPHRHGNRGCNALDRGKHPFRGGKYPAQSRPGRPALHRPQRSNPALVTQKQTKKTHGFDHH